MITLEQAKQNIGNKVIYLKGTDRQEEGIISSVNENYVFVRYGGNCTAQATKPKDLVFLV